VPIEFLKEAGVSEKNILNCIKGAKVFSYKENCIHFKRETRYAAVIDRIGFDLEMEERLKKANANVFYSSFVSDVKLDKNEALITLIDGRTFASKVVVVATGATNTFQKLFDMKADKSEDIYTVQVDAELTVEDREIVYIYMNNDIAHNWFAWVIPTQGNYVRIGFGTDKKGNILKKLDELFSTWSMLKGVARVGKPVVWNIPIRIAKETVFKNVLFVGDAARQVKPFSGGGLLTGFVAANLATEAIERSLESSAMNSSNFYSTLSTYDKVWRKELEDEFKKELFLRNIYRTLTDEDKDIIIKSIDEKAIDVVLKYGYMDKPSVAGYKLLLAFSKIPLLYISRKVHNTFSKLT
jgi:digeranylgeranylglycerophospholipid reductase